MHEINTIFDDRILLEIKSVTLLYNHGGLFRIFICLLPLSETGIVVILMEQYGVLTTIT